MRWQYICKTVGILVIFLGFAMLFPMICSLLYQDSTLIAHLISMGVTILSGGAFYIAARRTSIGYISPREGMAIVAVGWTLIGLFGALPFYFGGACTTFTDAFFESVSG
ncbi:MAG: TrkH family potassium uptake protein, partial [Desulfamplus sp.]|nr:TrkH family potassium uptake protein [Desulfamplus sp.]